MPPVQKAPTRIRPFLFHQLRKGGVSGLRRYIYEAAIATGLPKEDCLVPCVHPSCEQLNFGVSENLQPAGHAIIAGHFSIADIWSQRWQVADANLTSKQQPQRVVRRKDSACLTNFRHPVNRVISCLSILIDDFELKLRKGILTHEDLDTYLTHTTAYGHGCNNEAVRMMSGYAVEEVHNSLSEQDPNFAKMLIDSSVRELRRCVIFVVDPPEKLINAVRSSSPRYNETGAAELNGFVLQHFLPWLSAASKWLPKVQALDYVPESDPKVIQLILQHNWPDMQVYKAALKVYAQQVAEALLLPPGPLLSAVDVDRGSDYLSSRSNYLYSSNSSDRGDGEQSTPK